MHLFSSVFTREDPNTAPTFHSDKSDDTSLSSIAINPSIAESDPAIAGPILTKSLTHNHDLCRTLCHVQSAIFDVC